MTLDEVRVNIDRVDRQIKELFQERMDLADQVAQVKAKTGDAILKPDRETAMISRLTNDIPPAIKKEYTALLKRIIEISRKYQYGRTLDLRDDLKFTWNTEDPDPRKPVMVKAELYVCDMVPKDIVQTVDTFDQVGQLVAEGAADAGIGILEDVGIGPEQEIHSMLVEKKFYINRCRVVKDGQACRKVCMFTPHLIVRPEHNRIKVMFVCPNKAGALASILTMISDYGINLTEIHSCPDRKQVWNYEFFVELSGNLLNKEVQALIFQLSKETEDFRILGSYSCEGDF